MKCEKCDFEGEFVIENYADAIITFCKECYHVTHSSCTHEKIGLVKYSVGGNFRVQNICRDCKMLHGSFVKQSDKNINEIRTIDKAKYDQWRDFTLKKHSDRTKKLNELFQAWSKTKWLKQHTDYLNTPEWRLKREYVLKRDNYICQACLLERATQVHHLSYDHYGKEPIFELISVCKSCHDAITEMDNRKDKVY